MINPQNITAVPLTSAAFLQRLLARRFDRQLASSLSGRRGADSRQVF